MTNLKSRVDFNKDLKLLKNYITKIRSAHSSLTGEYKVARAELIHKHIYNIRQFQTDMNKTVSEVRKSEKSMHMKSLLLQYREFARRCFRKYHVGLRDLRNNNMVRVDWRLRSILERHAAVYNTYRFGVRIMPGRNTWKDPL
jgi:hypothetical protein